MLKLKFTIRENLHLGGNKPAIRYMCVCFCVCVCVCACVRALMYITYYVIHINMRFQGIYISYTIIIMVHV